MKLENRELVAISMASVIKPGIEYSLPSSWMYLLYRTCDPIMEHCWHVNSCPFGLFFLYLHSKEIYLLITLSHIRYVNIYKLQNLVQRLIVILSYDDDSADPDNDDDVEAKMMT